MFAASDQSRDDLCDTALLALVGVGHQAFHVWPQQRQKGIVEIAEQSLWEQTGRVNVFSPADSRFLHLKT